jgi:hypothetical protein
MKKQIKNTNVKKLAMAGAVALGIVAGGFAGAYIFPNTETIVVEKIVNNTIEVPVETIVEVPYNVTVEKIVEVDNGNLDIVLQEIYDNNGRVQYLLDDLDEDELDLIVDRIAFVNDIKALAVAEVKSELFDEVDRMIVDGVELDEDEMERLRIDDDLDEINVADIDFEDKDAKLEITGTFEQEDVKYSYKVEIEFKDGEVYDFDVLEVLKL